MLTVVLADGTNKEVLFENGIVQHIVDYEWEDRSSMWSTEDSWREVPVWDVWRDAPKYVLEECLDYSWRYDVFPHTELTCDIDDKQKWFYAPYFIDVSCDIDDPAKWEKTRCVTRLTCDIDANPLRRGYDLTKCKLIELEEMHDYFQREAEYRVWCRHHGRKSAWINAMREIATHTQPTPKNNGYEDYYDEYYDEDCRVFLQ